MKSSSFGKNLVSNLVNVAALSDHSTGDERPEAGAEEGTDSGRDDVVDTRASEGPEKPDADRDSKQVAQAGHHHFEPNAEQRFQGFAHAPTLFCVV